MNKTFKLKKPTKQTIPKLQEIAEFDTENNTNSQNDFFDVYPQLDYLKHQIEVLDEIPDSKPKPKLNIEEIKKKLKNIPQIYTKKFLLIQG